MANRIQMRRDTASNWTTVNPTLAIGELGFETESPNRFKIGDGVSDWNTLSYYAGSDGTDGSQILTGSGAPAGSLGNQGDFYYDSSTNDFYSKTGSTTWTLVGNTAGPQGPQGTPGTDGTDGVDGQRGSLIETGTSLPPVTGKLDGDLFINTSSGEYFRFQSGAYVSQGNLTGPTGEAGDDFLQGTVDPINSLGKDGDSYINTTSGDIFLKSSGTWSLTGNVRGPQGAPGGPVADADYGDITVSNSGTTWTIDNGVVTAAKVNSGASTNGQVLTADGAGGASFQDSSGGIEAASAAEVKAGTSNTVGVTPGRLQEHQAACKGWVNLNGEGTPSIRDSFNVSSVTDQAVGVYTVNFATNFDNTNYAVAGMAQDDSFAGNMIVGGSNAVTGGNYRTTSSFSFSVDQGSTAEFDVENIYLVFFGD